MLKQLRDTGPKINNIAPTSTRVLQKFLTFLTVLPFYNSYLMHILSKFAIIPPDDGITICRNMLEN
jgi:hypothetical protein